MIYGAQLTLFPDWSVEKINNNDNWAVFFSSHFKVPKKAKIAVLGPSKIKMSSEFAEGTLNSLFGLGARGQA